VDILDLLDSEADRIQYETMVPTSEQRRGADNFYSDKELQRTLENKIDSHFVVASVNIGDSEYETTEEQDTGILDIVRAIDKMSESLHSAISNINLNFGERFEKEYSSQIEATNYLEKLFILERDELKRQERERLMSVQRDLQPSDLTTSSSVATGVNPYADKQGSDSGGGFGFIPDFGGNDKDKNNKDKNDKNNKKQGWFRRTLGKVRNIPLRPKDIAKYALGTAAVAGTGYAMFGGSDEEENQRVATPAQNNNTRKDPWNYWPNGSPKTDLSDLKPSQRSKIEAQRKRAWEAKGRQTPSETTIDPDTKPIEPSESSNDFSMMDTALTFSGLGALPMVYNAASAVMPDIGSMWRSNREPKTEYGPKAQAAPNQNPNPRQSNADRLKTGLKGMRDSSIAKTTGKVLGKANVVTNVALGGLDAYDIYNDDSLSEKEKTVELSGVGGSMAGGIAGGAVGAKLGAMGGLAFGPIGALVGGAVLGIAGSIGGALLGEEAVEAAADSIYSWFDDDENEKDLEKELETTASQTVTKVEQENQPESAEEIITKINVKHAAKEKALNEASANGKSYAVMGNSKVVRNSQGNIESSEISRELSNAKNKAKMERRLFVGKLKPSLLNYAEDNNIAERHVDNVLSAYSNPMMTFGDATVIARDLLSDPTFEPNSVMANYKQTSVANVNTFAETPTVSDYVTQASYPVNTNIEADANRENFVEVREVKTVSQYDKAAEVAKAPQPKPVTNKRKAEKPKTVIKTVQAPLSLNLIDNLENQAGLNYLGSTF
jgi:hypothetical protein